MATNPSVNGVTCAGITPPSACFVVPSFVVCYTINAINRKDMKQTGSPDQSQRLSLCSKQASTRWAKLKNSHWKVWKCSLSVTDVTRIPSTIWLWSAELWTQILLYCIQFRVGTLTTDTEAWCFQTNLGWSGTNLTFVSFVWKMTFC